MVALSTCETEYVAAATATCQAVWLHRLLGELTGVKAHPPALMVDNQSAIALAKNSVLHDRSKHIDVKFHFLKDCIHGGQIVIEFVETGWQLEDVLTKPLGRLWFTELKKMIDMEGVLGLTAGLGKELLSNMLLPCVNARQGQAPRAPCCCTVAAAGAGAKRLPCRTVATAGVGAKVSSTVVSSHRSSMTA